MKWENVKIQGNNNTRNKPFASVGRGKLTLSAGACKLIEDQEEYKFAQFMKAKENGKLYVGIRLLKEDAPNALHIARKKLNGKMITAMEITNKSVMEALFGVSGSADKTTQYEVRKDDDEENVLVISL